MHIRGAEEHAEYRVIPEKTAVVQVYRPYLGIPDDRPGSKVRQGEAEILFDEKSRSKYLDLVRATVKEKSVHHTKNGPNHNQGGRSR